MEITSLDMSILMEDFKKLEGGHVQKVYQRKDELTVEIYVGGDGKKRLIIGTSYCFLSKYKRDNPTRPPGFCMELRKHLGKLDKVVQRGFDRILELHSGDVKLVCEIFGKGNFILVKDGDIIGALRQEEWADRDILVGEEYKYPEPADDPREIEGYVQHLEEGETVRRLASDLSLGGTYAEEICSRTGVEKTKNTEDLSDGETEKLNSEIANLLEKERFPVGYYEENDPIRPSPFRLETYSDYREEEFSSFSKAMDQHFYRKEKRQEEKEKEEAYLEKKEGLERQREQMERKIEGLEKSAEQKREDAERIYENYQLLERIKRNLENGIEKHSWERTREIIDERKQEEEVPEDIKRINSINEQDEFVSVELESGSIKIYLFQDLEATASEFYDKAKESESKISSAKEALQKVKRDLEDLEKEEIDVEDVMEDKTRERKKKWFEKYRWFYSSEGYLIICGRDVQTNEMVVKKHMEKKDLYLHADFDGAPSVVIKDGQEAGEDTIEEAAKAAVTFTKTWKAGIGSDDVYYVDPDQVTEDPESGEYREKGSFIIRGDRTYLRNISVEASIGPYEIDDDQYVPMSGPKSAVEDNCPESVDLKPGHTKKSDVAKQIREKFEENGYSLDLDYIIRAMPPGEAEIK